MGTDLDAAFAAIPRENFLPADQRAHADWDMPLPIGYGQTNSQPTVVRWMLEWLDVKPGQKILDVGSGSGWTTALLSHLVGPDGLVIAVEKIPELVEIGRRNCHHIGIWNVEFHEARQKVGWEARQPYDRILVSAGSQRMPQALVDQLKPVDGRIVVPVVDDIIVGHKTPEGLDTEKYQGFVFVPLT